MSASERASALDCARAAVGLALGLALAASACGAASPPSSGPAPAADPAVVASPPVSTAPAAGAGSAAVTAGDGALTVDGRHFAAERVYQGECAPPGTRGGCHTLTLRPDGSFRNWLFDAGLEGSYVIEGDSVVLTPSGAAPPERLTLSADRTRLGDLTLQR